jgi:osmotically-inducible protein OsmY
MFASERLRPRDVHRVLLFRTPTRDDITMNTFKIHAAAAAIALAFSAAAIAQNPSRAEVQAAQDRYSASMTAAKSEYSIARAKCNELSVGDKKACLTDATAARSRARADARAELKSANAPVPAARTAAAPKKETPTEYVGDAAITTKVKAAIFNDPSLKSTEINVETYKGIVQLSGFVRSSADINRAVEVARGVGGVTSVKNVMIVKGQQ